MCKTGEKPGKGTYRCTSCGTTVTLDDHDDRLPPCPKCEGTTKLTNVEDIKKNPLSNESGFFDFFREFVIRCLCFLGYTIQ